MSARVFLLTAALCACRDPATLAGTALLVSVDSSEVAVDQLRYEAASDAGSLFDPTLRPETAGGLLAPNNLVRVLLKDELGGHEVEVKVAGLVGGEKVGEASGRVLVEKGFERLLALKLSAPMMSCAGCVDAQGSCVATTGVAACGANGSACRACDARLANACSAAGTCACGSEPACSAALGADRCANGRCQCGSGPACEAGQECLAQTCQCTPTSCAGCCVGSTCITNPSSTNCGSGGRACLDCGVTTCTGGQCGQAVCNGTTCPTGCCVGSTCVTSLTEQLCGRGGMACVSCGAGTCDLDAGACTGGCSPATCPTGCCAGGVCEPGTTPQACGTGGAACASCSSGCTNQACDSPCGPATCPTGCCQGGQCQTGRAVGACGTGGASCSACNPQDTCPAGTCVVSASCNASNCGSGCCNGNTCVTPPTTQQCGLAGRSCRTCTAPYADGCNLATGDCACGTGRKCIEGERCMNSRCECDPATCQGCCNASGCQNGDRKQACGRNGVTCVSCTGSSQCSNSACTP